MLMWNVLGRLLDRSRYAGLPTPVIVFPLYPFNDPIIVEENNINHNITVLVKVYPVSFKQTKV